VSVKTKEPMTIEFLTESPTFERIILFYKPALERLGVTVTARTVDDAQYENRLRSWDYDAVIGSWGQSLSPGNEQLGFWGSAAADQPGSRNLIGIKDPAIDALIERGDLRQEPCRAGGRYQGTRSCAAAPSLCRAAVDLQQSAHRALGSFRPSREHAALRQRRRSRPSGGGTHEERRRRDRAQ
jgi:hypothetical protein